MSSEPVYFTDFESLILAMPSSWIDEWKALYPDSNKRRLVMQRAFVYHKNNPEQPYPLTIYKAIFNKWLSEDFNSRQSSGPYAGLKNIKVQTYKSDPPKPYVIKCEHCDDLQVIRAEGLDATIDTLMLCSCADLNDPSHWQLPQWQPFCGRLFKRTKCPLAWFKPDSDTTGMGVAKGLEVKVREWRKRIKDSEDFWKEQRNLLNQDTTNGPG